MNPLSLILLLVFALASCATVPDKVTNANDVPQQAATDKQAEVEPQDGAEDKKVAKRSYGWNPWSYIGYSYGWPWYGFGHGWYPGWPLPYGHGYGGYGGYGYHGGWYKGW
ncbi:PREDICTED: glycine-rich protein-like [Dufourea novaeangliae]|uniref:glycine-rich protein-like n=1 Tax=Dufourea novaeangliae TaxID=178035 RepID=UPI000767CB14|nr:PREDICTED: glycine-rich protein-like [Dufourea novaeangliae]